ncbi:hypothetical protein Tco_1421813 [Tanacetum coccineum]
MCSTTMMWNSNTMFVNSKQQYYQKLNGTVMKEMSLNPYHLNDTCRKVQNHILASTTKTILTLWISTQKRSTILLSLSIMLRDTTKKVLKIGSLKDRVKKFVAITLKLLMDTPLGREMKMILQSRNERLDEKEYEFSYADLPRLNVNNVEDIKNRDQEQSRRYSAWSGKLSKNSQPHQTYNVLRMNRPKDTFTMTAMHKGVMYLNQYNIKSLIKLSEVKKFMDGTLVKIQENLIDILSKNKLGNDNKRLKGRDWTDYDVKSSRNMLKKIDEILRHREQIRRLEDYVGGRPKTINPHTFVRPL